MTDKEKIAKLEEQLLKQQRMIKAMMISQTCIDTVTDLVAKEKIKELPISLN